MAQGGTLNGSPPKDLHLGDLKAGITAIYDTLIALAIPPDDAGGIANIVRCQVKRRHRLSQGELGPEAFPWGRDPTLRKERYHRTVETITVNKENEGVF